MKIKSRNETPDHVITLIEKSELYTVMISRLNPPFFSIHYDHLKKTGEPVEDQPEISNFHLILQKPIKFGLHHVEFDEQETEALKNNSSIKRQFEDFINSLEFEQRTK
jgi:hypothetical protein